MAQSIGSLALKLTADATDLLGTLEKAQRRVTAFTAGVVTKFTQSFRVLTDPLRSVEAGLSSFFDITGEGSKLRQIADTARAADRLGTSTETLIVAAKAAQVEVSDMVGPLFRAQAQLGKTALAADAVNTPLEKWGLNTQQLRAGGLEVLIEAVAEKMPELATGADQAALATAAFGRAGLGMIPVLQKGAAGLAELKEKLRGQGLLFSREDAQRAIDAVQAVRTLKGSFEGIKTQLALAFAPLVTDIANGLQSWVDKMGGGREIAKAFAKTIFDIAIGVVEIAKAVSDLVASLNVAKGIKGAAEKFYDFAGGGGGTEGPDKLQAAIDYLQKMKAGIDDLGKGGGLTFLGQMENLVKTLVDDQRDLAVEALKLQNALLLEAAGFGKTGHELELFKLEQRGATDAMLAGARAAAGQIKVLEDMKGMADAAAKIWEETLNPAEQFIRQVDELNTLAGAGVLDWNLWGRAMGQASARFESAFPSAMKGPEALLAGSAGAISAINAEFNRTERTNPFKRAEELLEQLRQLGEQQLDQLKKQAGEAGLLPNLIQ